MSFFSSCIKKECKIAGGYEFEGIVNLAPAIDSFKIGDTIKIISEFSNMIFERHTDRSFLLENLNFYPRTEIQRIDTLSNNAEGLPDFDVIIPEKFNYDLGSNGTSIYGEYNYENNQYSLQYNLIPNKKGIYWFKHISDVAFLGRNQDFPDKCDNLSFVMSMKMNEGFDNNVDLLLSSPGDFFTRIWENPQTKFHDYGGYCFYVVD